jgi:hypothetical protein
MLNFKILIILIILLPILLFSAYENQAEIGETLESATTGDSVVVIENDSLKVISSDGLAYPDTTITDITAGNGINSLGTAGKDYTISLQDSFTVERVNTDTLYAARVKLDSTALLATPQAGSIEFSNDRFYITNVGTQRTIVRSSDVLTDSLNVSNTTSETVIYTGVLGANDLKAGNKINVETSGLISNNSASDDITIKVYIGSTELSSFNPAIGNVTNAVWCADFDITVYSVGANGKVAFHGHTEIDDDTVDNGTKLQTIDMTAAQNLKITATWDNAKADNVITIYQGFMEWKN